jgi:outer membrane protein assembly factor BamB
MLPRAAILPKFALALIAALAAPTLPAHADDWPHWRGPQRNGISAEKGFLTEWPSGEPPIAWRAKVGLGFSSIVVGDGRAFTVGHEGKQDTVFSFDAVTGKVVWKHSYAAELGDVYFEGGTTGTPTLAGDRLYWLSRWGDAFCFEAATGKIVWSKNLQKETGAPGPDWGFTGAPLVHENIVIVNMGDAGAAVEKDTGKLVWKSAEKNCGYSTPLPIVRDGKTLAVLASSQSYVAIEPATGKEAWRIRYLTQYNVNAADPVIDGDRVLLSTGYGKGAALYRIGAGEPEQLWKSKALRTQMNAAVLLDGYLYGADGDTTEKAALKCLDFATGKEKWAQANFGSGAAIVADGQLIALSGIGELLIAKASPESFKPTTRAQVLGGKCWTAPVLANGIIYCRNSRGEIAAVDARKE